MLAELTPELLEEVAGRTIEDAAFVLIERASGERFTGAVVRATVPFSCSCQGTVAVAAARTFAVFLAANFLGLDRDDPAAVENGEDALGELLNIVAGAVLERLFGAQELCRVGVPVMENLSSATHQVALEQSACWVSLVGDDEHRIDISVDVEGG